MNQHVPLELEAVNIKMEVDSFKMEGSNSALFMKNLHQIVKSVTHVIVL